MRRARRKRLAVRDPQGVVLSVVFLACVLWLYGAVFTDTVQDNYIGADAPPDAVQAFDRVVARTMICVLPTILLTGIALLAYGVEAIFSRSKRQLPTQPLKCAGCGATGDTLREDFKREPVEGTGWEIITCSHCGYDWHERQNG